MQNNQVQRAIARIGSAEKNLRIQVVKYKKIGGKSSLKKEIEGAPSRTPRTLESV
ncbi:hypothetical protein Scep_004719 [Stephania cephalantha]|uniref:Uncharacterized protein n=1 Tax=Stephania cephalantha TaxID=152367 RepID=A0AAP0KVG3_9MAGN